MRATETQIQRAILDYLALKNIFHYRQNSGALKDGLRFFRCASINGLPDIVLIVKGRYIGIEVKSATGRLSKAQLETHRKIKEAGAEVYIIRSIDALKQLLERILI